MALVVNDSFVGVWIASFISPRGSHSASLGLFVSTKKVRVNADSRNTMLFTNDLQTSGFAV